MNFVDVYLNYDGINNTYVSEQGMAIINNKSIVTIELT